MFTSESKPLWLTEGISTVAYNLITYHLFRFYLCTNTLRVEKVSFYLKVALYLKISKQQSKLSAVWILVNIILVFF